MYWKLVWMTSFYPLFIIKFHLDRKNFPSLWKLLTWTIFRGKNPTFYDRKDSLMHIFTCQSQQNCIVNRKINDIRFSYNKFINSRLWNKVMDIVLLFIESQRDQTTTFLLKMMKERARFFSFHLNLLQCPCESISYELQITFKHFLALCNV